MIYWYGLFILALIMPIKGINQDKWQGGAFDMEPNLNWYLLEVLLLIYRYRLAE